MHCSSSVSDYSSYEDNQRSAKLTALTINYIVEAVRPPSPFAFGWTSLNPSTYPHYHYVFMASTSEEFIPPPSKPESPRTPRFKRSNSSASSSSNMSSKDNCSQLTILKQGTYCMWDMALRNLFQAKQISSLLLAESTVPSGPTATANEIEDYLEKQGCAMTFILGSLDEINKARITIHNTPHTAYLKLAKHHASNKGILTAMVISEITTICMNTDLLSQFLTKIHVLHRNLAIYTSDDEDLKISSKLLGIFLLNSLSANYANFKTPAFKQIKMLKVEDLLSELDVLSSAGELAATTDQTTTTAFSSNVNHSNNSRRPNNDKKKTNRQIGPGIDDLCNHPEHAKTAFHTNIWCRLHIREAESHGGKQVTAAATTTDSTVTPTNASGSTLSETQKATRYDAIVKVAAEAKKVTAAAAQADDFDPSQFIDSFPEVGFTPSAYAIHLQQPLLST